MSTQNSRNLSHHFDSTTVSSEIFRSNNGFCGNDQTGGASTQIPAHSFDTTAIESQAFFTDTGFGGNQAGSASIPARGYIFDSTATEP